MRNRIIAALSDAVLVVESREKGGSIITTEFANTYNKDVFAVPGRIGDENSAGCNKLIKIHKAYLAESAKDIAYIMSWEELDKSKVAQTSLFPDLAPEELVIVDALREAKELTIDHLHHTVQRPMSELSSMLLQLEFKGLVRSLPGKKYMLA
jgi:DNA processing protein